MELTISYSEFFLIIIFPFLIRILTRQKGVQGYRKSLTQNNSTISKDFREDFKFTFSACSFLLKFILQLLFQTRARQRAGRLDFSPDAEFGSSLFDQYVILVVIETSYIYSLIFSVEIKILK